MVFYFWPAIESSNYIAGLIQGAEVVYSFYCLLVNVSKHISFDNRFFFLVKLNDVSLIGHTKKLLPRTISMPQCRVIWKRQKHFCRLNAAVIQL